MSGLSGRVLRAAAGGLLVAASAVAVAAPAAAITPLSTGCQQFSDNDTATYSSSSGVTVTESFNAGETFQIRPAVTRDYTVEVDGQPSAGHTGSFDIPFTTTGTHVIEVFRSDGGFGSWHFDCAVPPTASLSVPGGPTYTYGARVPTTYLCEPDTYPVASCSDSQLGNGGSGTLDTSRIGPNFYYVIVIDSHGFAAISSIFRYTVVRATPVVTWNNPASITYPATLSATQLDATASVPGTFAYTPSTGTMLHAGTGQALSVTFTPTDSDHYNVVIQTVHIDVARGSQTISFTSTPADPSYGATYAPSAIATSSLPVSFSIPTVSAGVCTITGGVVSFVGVGSCTVNADQAGNSDYFAAPRVPQTFTAVRAGTRVVAAPAAKTLLGLTPTTFKATLTRLDNGLPISGQFLKFSVGSVSCAANTNTSGVAICRKAIGPLETLIATSYNVNFAGGALYIGSSSHASLR